MRNRIDFDDVQGEVPPPRARRPRDPVASLDARGFLAAVAVLATTAAGCSQRKVVDTLLGSAYHPRLVALGPVVDDSSPAPRYQLLAGDFHCHVGPPDDPSDVSRDFATTVKLAHEEHLDFVVLTPHVAARFFQNDAQREAVLAGQTELRAEIAAGPTDVLFVPGFEYTDHRYGHVGVAFADLGAVLADVPTSVAKTNPERFFSSWVEHGGTLVVNHPLVTPLASVFAMARADLSWRPWTSKKPVTAEIAAVDRLAQGFEAYNVTASQLRDRILLGDSDKTLEGTLLHLDAAIVARGRRMTPVGGSDSHGPSMRATTFVLAETKSVAGVREAFLAGRTCVRDAAACSFEARPPGGSEWSPIGAALPMPTSGKLEVRARGDDVEIIRGGAIVATPSSGTTATVDLVAGTCNVLRARVGEGFSAPIYVGCF